MMKTNKQFMHDWILENFDASCVEIIDVDENTVVVKDSHGETMTVEMRDKVLYADGKPFTSIPSLV